MHACMASGINEEDDIIIMHATAVHLQQRIAKQQNDNQIIRYEYHYQQ